LLDKTGQLLGIDPATEQQFCGLYGKGVNDLGFLSGRRGTEYKSVMSCYRLADKIEEVLNLIKQFNDFDFTTCIARISESSQSLNLEMLHAEAENLVNATRARRSLAMLTANAPLVDDPARSRTEEEAVEYAQQLFDALTTQVTGSDRVRAQVAADLNFGARFAPLCPVYPHRGFDGMVS
jgi:hypothetical protein